MERDAQATPMQTWGKPADIGEAVAFLCSEKGRQVACTCTSADTLCVVPPVAGRYSCILCFGVGAWYRVMQNDVSATVTVTVTVTVTLTVTVTVRCLCTCAGETMSMYAVWIVSMYVGLAWCV